MREIVVILSDLYLAPDESTAARPIDASDSLPSVSYLARFGRKSAIAGGWRAWLARWSGRDDLARVAPAAIAAASGVRALDRSGERSVGSTWFATPVHLIAGLTSLHLDRRNILHLPEQDLARLADEFIRVFGNSELYLEPTTYGVFLMRSRESIEASTTEPSRALVRDLQDSLPTGRDAPVLRRLGAELEMWLHAHPINQQRAARGEPPLSTLWLWGGGVPEDLPVARAPSRSSDIGLGSDPYLTGLWHLAGSERLPLPERFPNFSSHPNADRMVLVLEATPLLQANPNWTLFEVLADLDRRFIAPALAALRAGDVSSVVLVANDVELRIERYDHLKFWRRAPSSGLDALHSG